MANYNLVVNSTFQPFSFERYIQPYQMYGEAYKEVENAIADLDTKASVWEGMANEQTDPYAYGMYKKYADDLRVQAEALASQGLTPGSRKALLDMKGRYSKEITPIEQAYDTRQKYIDEQREALLKDNTLMFDNIASTMSLDSFIKNPNLSYTSLSGADITKRTAVMAKEAASAIMSDPEYSSVFGGQYVQQKLNQGYTLDQVIATAQRDPNAPKALLGIVDAVKNEVGYNNWNKDTQAKIDSYINEGLNAAIGTPKIDVMTDRSYMTELEAERLRLANELTGEQINQLKGEEIPGGGRVVKLGGGKFVQYDKDGNIVYSNAITTTPEQKAEQAAKTKLDETLSSVVKVSDMKGTGYNPVGVVALISGNWTGGREGEDIPDTWKGATRTNLKEESAGAHRFYDPMSWFTGSGNFSYTPYDSNAEATVVTNLETIPGFKEWLSEEGMVENSAFSQILEQAKKAGISDEEFLSDNVQIVQVKGRRSRKGSDTPYDYIIYRKS